MRGTGPSRLITDELSAGQWPAYGEPNGFLPEALGCLFADRRNYNLPT